MKNITKYTPNEIQPYTVIQQYEQPQPRVEKQPAKLSSFKKKAWLIVGITITCYVFLSFNSIDTMKWRVSTLVAFPIAVGGAFFLAIKSDGTGVKCHKLQAKGE